MLTQRHGRGHSNSPGRLVDAGREVAQLGLNSEVVVVVVVDGDPFECNLSDTVPFALL